MDRRSCCSTAGAAGAASWAPSPRPWSRRAVFLNPPAEMDAYADIFAATLGFTPPVIRRMIAGYEARSRFRWHDFEAGRLGVGQTAPLLVLSDTQDRQAPWRGGRAIAAAWPGARFEKTEGLGHSRILYDAGVVRRVVEFMAGS